MNIAFTMAPGKGDTDHLLQTLAERLNQQGFRTSGTVQFNTARAVDGPCDMDIKILPDGPVMRISQELGPGARGCRLDPEALDKAVLAVEASLLQKPDYLIINKFGRHEAEGRGFRSLIAEALTQDLPVLVGLNVLNEQAFHDFTEGLAVKLPPNLDALLEWCDIVLTTEVV